MIGIRGSATRTASKLLTRYSCDLSLSLQSSGGALDVIKQTTAAGSVKRSASVDQSPDPKRQDKKQSSSASGAGATSSATAGAGAAGSGGKFDVTKPIDKSSCDNVVNFLLRLACQVSPV